MEMKIQTRGIQKHHYETLQYRTEMLKKTQNKNRNKMKEVRKLLKSQRILISFKKLWMSSYLKFQNILRLTR